MAEGKHTHWRSVCLVFHLGLNLFVCGAVKRMIFWIIACVVQMFVAFDILVGVVSLYLQQKAVRIGVDKFASFSVLPFKRVIIEIIHQDFALFEYRHPCINWLVQLHTILVRDNTCKVFCELHAPRKQRARNQFANLFPFITTDYFYVYAFPHVLHCFPKHLAVYELVEVFLEIVCCVRPKFFVRLYVGLHPALLAEFQGPVNLLEFHPKL